jgi:hypothetical protein
LGTRPEGCQSGDVRSFSRLFVIFAALLLSLSPSAASAVELRLEGPCSALPGTTVEFRVHIHSTEILTVSAYQADVVFDPAVLQAVSYAGPADGRFSDGPAASRSNAAGTLSVSGLSCGSTAPGRGSVVVGLLRFQVVGAAGSSTSLSFIGASLLDGSGSYVPVQPVPLSFKVVSQADRDCDGVRDGVDNCPAVYNPSQTDTDRDGRGDACEELAVQLVSFTAEPRGKRVVLRWRTATEPDNAGFVLYRGLSPEGPWLRLTPALIPARGSAVSGASYEFVDRPPRRARQVYYLLQDVDVDGGTASQPPVKVILSSGGGGKAPAGVVPDEPGAPGGRP